MAKKLYFGGPILTMDQNNARVQAVLTEDAVILAAGEKAALEAMAPDAEAVDLKGCTLMPAFVDGHSHMAGEGIFNLKCDLIGCTGFEDLKDRIRKYREKNNYTHGEVLSCRGYDLASMKEGAHPVAAVLDELGFDNPIVCVHQSGHMLTANTAAMKYCGVDDSVETPAGGYIGRDVNGHLTGYFEEKANGLINSHFNVATEEQVEAGLEAVQEEYFRNGITTIQDGSGNGLKRIETFARLAESGKLKADVVVYMGAKAGEEAWNEIAERFGKREYRNHLKVGGIKIVLDGSPQARTAWMKEPYEGETEYRAYPCYTDEFVQETVLKASENGYQVLAHCNGDAAADQFVTAVEKAAAAISETKLLRHEVIHTQTTADAELDRMTKLGMIASVFAGHCWFWGDTHLKNFGPVRGNRISPAKQCIERGIPYNFHQDSPVTKPNMLHTIWCAVNRITKNGVKIGPEFRISAEEALWGATQGGAYSYFEEDTKGILKAGAVADMIILDRDPLAVDPMEIRDIKILETIKDGRTVYTCRN